MLGSACTKRNPDAVTCGDSSDCASSAPICDPSALVCRGCVSNADCAAVGGGTAACDTDTGQCVECVVDAECGTGRCVDSRCVACEGDGDCADGVCVAGACVECRDGGDCAAGAPVCEAGQCVECAGDGDGTTETLPVCNLGTNACVECVDESDCGDALPVCDVSTATCIQCDGDAACPVDAPICDDGSCRACAESAECTDPSLGVCDDRGQCVECAADGDCASLVCDRSARQCVPESAVVYLQPGGAEAGCAGTMADPCGTVNAAKPLTTGVRDTLRFAPGTYPDEGLIIIGGVSLGSAVLTFVGEGATMPTDVSVGVGGTLTVAGMTVGDVDCIGALLAVDAELANLTAEGCQVDIRDSRFGQLRASAGSTVTLLRNRIQFVEQVPGLETQLAGGLWLTDSAFDVRNNVITRNGVTFGQLGTGTLVGGVRIDGALPAGPRRFDFNTVAFNAADGNAPLPGAGIHCEADVPVAVSNSIVVQNNLATGPQIVGCQVEFSIVTGGFDGTGNLADDPRFVNPDGDDFHVAPDSPAIDAADATDPPALDIDREPRPRGDGFDIGADEAK